jgi:hypothetical protein
MTDEQDSSLLTRELKDAIRTEVVRKTAAGTVAAIVGVLAVAATGWLLYIKDRAAEWVNGVPRGAVMAFDVSDDCPDGWYPFDDGAGRFIIGAGEGRSLSQRNLRAEAHTLTLKDMPTLRINVPGLPATNSDRYEAGGNDYPVVTVAPGSISLEGGAEPISLLPPFIALQYCKKA